MNLEQLLEKVIQKAKLEAHPVGSYYFSDVSTPPSEIFGGTWIQVKDRFILTAGDTYQQGQTGGEVSHTLTASELPTHSHYITKQIFMVSNPGAVFTINDSNFDALAATDCAVASGGVTVPDNLKSIVNGGGGNQPHNNLPPYVVTYCWKRTA